MTPGWTRTRTINIANLPKDSKSETLPTELTRIFFVDVRSGMCFKFEKKTTKGAHSYFNFLYLRVLNGGGKITYIFAIPYSVATVKLLFWRFWR